MSTNIYTVTLPDIGEGVAEGEIIEWLKLEGASVQQDEPVVIVMTDKATVELPAPYPGLVTKHYYKAGEIAYKDKPLYDIQLSAEAAAEFKIKEKVSKSPSIPLKPSKQVSQFALPMETEGKALATPKTRCLAKQLGIDLNQIQGSGTDGRVLLEDLFPKIEEKRLIETIKPLEGDEEQSLMGIRALMAKKMAATHQNIPQFSYFEEADATRLISLREKIREKAWLEGIHLSFMPFFIRALSLTIKKYPLLNSSIDMQAGKIIVHHQHNIAIAMAAQHGLIVPVLKGIQNMTLEELIRTYEEFKNKALKGKLSSADMKEATITLSNFGALGEGVWATPMVSEPEVAILALARIKKVPVVKDNAVVIRDLMPLSWSFDHRLIDGQLAAAISREYSRLLKDPAALL